MLVGWLSFLYCAPFCWLTLGLVGKLTNSHLTQFDQIFYQNVAESIEKGTFLGPLHDMVSQKPLFTVDTWNLKHTLTKKKWVTCRSFDTVGEYKSRKETFRRYIFLSVTFKGSDNNCVSSNLSFSLIKLKCQNFCLLSPETTWKCAVEICVHQFAKTPVKKKYIFFNKTWKPHFHHTGPDDIKISSSLSGYISNLACLRYSKCSGS